MLLQPYVYAGNMEGVPTVGEDTQYIFAMEFCKANCASATFVKYLVSRIHSQEMRGKKKYK